MRTRALEGAGGGRGPPTFTIFMAGREDEVRLGPGAFVAFHQDLEEISAVDVINYGLEPTRILITVFQVVFEVR